MRFMAMASVSWASREIEPYDMAPVAKRLTMSTAGSTSSSGIGRSANLKSSRPRSVSSCALLLVDQLAELAESSRLLMRVAVLQLGDHFGAEDVGFALAAPLVLAADVEVERFGGTARPRAGVFVAAQRFIGHRRPGRRLRCGWGSR